MLIARDVSALLKMNSHARMVCALMPITNAITTMIGKNINISIIQGAGFLFSRVLMLD
jgi:hypothetical protein